MKQLTVISGKGGTGKTSIVACFGQLARNVILADCDVDAANLHLLVKSIQYRVPPQIVKSGYEMVLDPDICTECGVCEPVCRFDALSMQTDHDSNRFLPVIDPINCEGCGCCADVCPVEAIGMTEKTIGELYVSNTRLGPLIHACLKAGESNSGKLVTQVRETANKYAENENRSLLIIDGSPGIGCPVIASLTGADFAVIVTESSLSGKHDFERIAELCSHFKIKTSLVINKSDLDQDLTEKMINEADEKGITVAGTIPYSPLFVKAMVQQQTVLEYAPDSDEAAKIRRTWQRLSNFINPV